MTVKELPTRAVKDRQDLEQMVTRLKERFDNGNLSSLAMVFYDKDGTPYTWISDSMSLSNWAYGLTLMQSSLLKVIGDPA